MLPASSIKGRPNDVLQQQCGLRGLKYNIKKDSRHIVLSQLIQYDRDNNLFPKSENPLPTPRVVTPMSASDVNASISDLLPSTKPMSTATSSQGTKRKLDATQCTAAIPTTATLDPTSDVQDEHDCTCKKVPCKVVQTIDLLFQTSDERPLSPSVAKSILKKYITAIEDDATVCFNHTKRLASRLGYKVRRLNYDGLKSALRSYYTEGHDSVAKDNERYKMLKRANRDQRLTDRLGPSQYFPSTTPKFTFDSNAILDHLDPTILTRWHRDGTINIDDIFTWWWQQPADPRQRSIGEIALEEFACYKHHLREISGEPNLGWLRNSFYSIGQQLMRQDPLYYLIYCCLRPDKAWRLISYPYYCKYASPGDKVFFRHVDLDLSRLIKEGRGGCMIQGSVSLDDEHEDDCTEIVPGLHVHTKEWVERMEARKVLKHGFVQRISDGHFTEADAEHFGTNWTPVPCKRGTVRISMPHLPHGARSMNRKGLGTRVRRTYLPWYVAIDEDHERLEVEDGGTWGELSKAHITKMPGPKTPSGLINKYGALKIPFAATVDVSHLGKVSDALVGRLPWTDSAVTHERDILLGTNRLRAMRYIDNWRDKARLEANKAFRESRRAEKLFYGERSYYYRKENGITGPRPEEIDSVVVKQGDQQRLDGFVTRGGQQ